MKPLPLVSEDGRTGHPPTMTLGEVYDAIAYMLTEQGLDRDMPLGVYTRIGASSLLAFALVHPTREAMTEEPPSDCIMLVGEDLPYGVAVERHEKHTTTPQVPHRDYPTRPTLIELGKITETGQP